MKKGQKKIEGQKDSFYKDLKESLEDVLNKEKKFIKIQASQLKNLESCTGILDFENSVNVFSENSLANQGTKFHEIFEKEVEIFLDKDFDLKLTNFENYDPEIQEQLTLIFRVIKNLDLKKDKFEYYLEKRFSEILNDFEFVAKSDLIIIDKEKNKISIIDYKTGFTEIEAVDNSQIELTARILYSYLDKNSNTEFEGIIINTVIQSVNYNSFFIDSVKENNKYFLDLEKKFSEKSRKLSVGSQCRYCQFAPVCPEFQKNLKKFLNPHYKKNIQKNRKKALAEILNFTGIASKVLEDLYKEAKNILISGEKIEGFELEFQNSKRQWNHNLSISELEKVLKLKKDSLKDEKLKTVAQAEKIISSKIKTVFEDLITVPRIAKIKKSLDKFSE